MKTSTTSTALEEVPNALDMLTEIALLKDSQNQEERRRAETLFVELLRYYEPILRSMANKLLPFNGATRHFDTDDLYARLAEKIWLNAAKFNPEGSGTHDVHRQFLAWTFRILRNTVNTLLASLQLEGLPIEYIDESEYNELTANVPDPSKRAKILAEILEEMDPDDAEVIRWSVMFQPLDGSQMRTDPQEREELCRKLGVTPASLRKRRQRALKDLRDELEARMNRLS